MHRLRALATSTLLLGACTQAEEPAVAPAPPPAAVEPAPASAPQIFEVTIASVPSGAAVTLQGAELGVTPYVLKYKKQTSVLVTADGFFAKEITVGPDSDPTVVATLTPLDDATGGTPSDPAPTEPTAAGAVVMADKPPPTATAKASVGGKPASTTEAKPGSSTASTGSGTASAGTTPTTTDADKPAPKGGSLPYDNVAAAKADYQAGKINRDTYDQAVRKLKARRTDKLLVIKELYRQGTIDKGEYQRRKRIIDNEYKGI